MNGTVEAPKPIVPLLGLDRRPIITCAGELEVFSNLEENLSKTLPKDLCDWKRAQGRPVKSVRVGANFVPFSVHALPKPGQWDLVRQPLFHIYWTECTEVDVYKSTIREEIDGWLKELNQHEIGDWLIVVVENYDGRRTNKLIPRTTVLDKIRADFAIKQGDRCISVINPGKAENKTAESWRGLVNRIRHLLLVAYARAFTRLEDYVRQLREKRNQPGWSFMNYFYLQEELAQILEMLDLPDEALIQYDELDALFSQFVSNCNSVKWLSQFQNGLDKWWGLKLGPINKQLDGAPSILELRSYLFGRQSQMLLMSGKVWEMASRCLPFLHTCLREINILEVTAPSGALWCWLFLAVMEVLHVCRKYNQADQVEEYSLHTAALWEYASQKLRSLGELCGLMPKGTPTSEQLHIVVSLSAGMGDNPGPVNDPSPTDLLKEALCSQEVFIKTYLELAELAMGSYKHVGRLRMARLVGQQLSSFYLLLGETQKAAAFLGDAARTFEGDGWHELAAQTHLDLAECHKTANDVKKYIRSCGAVSAALEMDTIIRSTYFDEMCKALEELNEPLDVPLDNVIRINSIHVNSGLVVMQNWRIEAELVVESYFPREVICNHVCIALELEKDAKPNRKYLTGKLLTKTDLKWQDPLLQRLKFKRNLDYKENKQLAGAELMASFTQIPRKDLGPAHLKTDFSLALEADKVPLLLTPGVNSIKLSRLATDIEKYSLDCVALTVNDNLQFISPQFHSRLTIEVKEQSPSIKFYKQTAPLISGVEQIMNLILTVGSCLILPTSVIKLTASYGLSIQTDPKLPLGNNVEIVVGDKPMFSSTRIYLRVLADLLTKDHQVTIHVPWISKPVVVALTFNPPMSTTWRLFTVRSRKFIQINVVGHCVDSLIVHDPLLTVKNVEVFVKHRDSSSSLVISHGVSYSFLWELETDTVNNAKKAEFTLQYKLNDRDEFKLYRYFFDVTDFKTLYEVDAMVEPAKGNEFCRVGVVCNLQLSIENVSATDSTSLMYEVFPEQSMWAMCARSAGVITFKDDKNIQQEVVEVMPLISGYLPLPLIRISKYIPADSGKNDIHPKLEPFASGQVYNKSKGKQIHVIAAANESNPC